MVKRVYGHLREIIIKRILHLDDTPHRIAWGVLLGFAVAWTPTIGFQILIYVAIATLLRANKVSGIPILFISNPFTAVPLYYFCWRVGSLILHGDSIPESARHQVRARLADVNAHTDGFWSELMTKQFWSDLLQTILDMGGELWLGSLILGITTGIIGYFVTLWAVKEYRKRHHHRLAPSAESQPLNDAPP